MARHGGLPAPGPTGRGPDILWPLNGPSRSAWLAASFAVLALVSVRAEEGPLPPPEKPPLALEARPAGEQELAEHTALVESARRTDYRIGRQDLLEIEVFDVDELTRRCAWPTTARSRCRCSADSPWPA